ncbi:Ribosomal protein S6 modification protein [Polystyrenella longa]|uniref:Ribosomal protein S6 modification protein n=1 Tax=Polystyrenella longa TaxID=2528007 RepID=A0A518CLR5_9PLAN|nr:RimK family alpha-L-glutamate ligase [Polystyrenella longa]QDU80171.1 Ribosomal protein S6 modification protein [Polystyrenella longa]
MRVGILSHSESWYYRELNRALTDRGHQTVLLDFHQLTASLCENDILFDGKFDGKQESSVNLLELDAILVRSMPAGSLEQVIWRMDLLSRLEAQGVQVLNKPKGLECAIDKYLTTARLQSAGLPVPPTIVCESTDQACEAFETLGGDVVVKPLFGSEGRGIIRMSDPDLAWRTFRTLEATASVLYLQKFIQHEGADIRGLILNGHLVGGMKRLAGNNFRTNISVDGTPTRYELTEHEEQLCLQAAATVGVEFAGVDLLYDCQSGQPYVLEVNGVPGWRALEQVNQINVADILVEELASRS